MIGATAVYFRVLGPVEIWEEDRLIPVGTLKAQCVLAILLLESGSTVSARSLADRLWDGEPPLKERETLQAYISRIRGRLREAGDAVGLIRASRAGGYALDVPAEVVDARKFDLAVTRARAAVSDPEAAVSMFREAEALWGGEPLAGIPGQWAEGTRRALWERRRSAVLTRIDLELRLGGDPDDLVSELAALTAIGGVDQAAVGLLMRALSRAGRLADALAAYQHARTRLREELGADPGPELRAVHRGILSGEPVPAPVRRAVVAAGQPGGVASRSTPLNTLDRDPRHLVGREAELAALLAAVRADLAAGGVALYAIDGMPGIGKTSLAVRAAHLLGGECPDGQIQINFRSHHPHQAPIGALEALRQLLYEVGAQASDVGRADSTDALAALWRRHIQGKHVLLLLDDVHDLEQVECLLPTSPGSVALLTSRRRLNPVSGLRQHPLRTLPEVAARSLLAAITERDFADDAEALDRFIARCGGLPLAITVSAAHLRNRPSWSLADLVARLSRPEHRSADDQITGPVDTAIALSYFSLTHRQRTLLCRLAGHPGPDIGLPAAAALAQAGLTATDLALDHLVEHHLLEETARHRYRLHDVVREFALDRAWHERTLDDVEEAVRRAFDFYSRTAERAERRLWPSSAGGAGNGKPTAAEAIDDAVVLESREAVRGWLDQESANLTAILDFATAQGWKHQAASLLHVLAGHLDRRGHWREALELLHRAAEGAPPDGVGDSSGFIAAAQVQTSLAALHTRTGEFERALAHARTALDIWSANQHDSGRAEATLHTGRIHWLAGRREEAAEAFTAAADMFGRVQAPDRKANAEYHLGIVLFELGRLDEAFTWEQRVLAAASELADSELRSEALINLGEMHLLADECDTAMAYFHLAQPLAAALGDRQCLAVLATDIGAVHRRRGQCDLALASFHDALVLARSAADQRNETATLIQAAVAHIALGNGGIAARQLRRAERLAAEGRDPLLIARVHLATGLLHQHEGTLDAALESFTAALAEAESAQAPLDQAHALRAIGELLAPRDPAAGRSYLKRAEAGYRRFGRRGAALAAASIV
ncbi:MAG: tetratricopeptide repeat protein [Catenulispora sp.]|nr:tetratricopeptide repeat protein [Catenulispora sp.]